MHITCTVLPVALGELTLGELTSLTSLLQAILLPFLHTRVTGQHAGLLKRAAEVRINGQQGTGNAVTSCASLARETAAINVNKHVIAASSFSDAKWLA